jgi:hypothetical protein
MTAMYSVSAQLAQRLPGPIAGFLGLAVLAAIILFWTVVQHAGVMAMPFTSA